MRFFDALTNMTPEQNQGLLAAAASILQGAGNPRAPFGFGQALGAGITGFQQGTQDAQDRAYQQQVRGLQMEDARMSADERKRKRQLEQQIQAAALASVRNPAQMALGGGGGPTQANADAMQGMQPSFDEQAFINRVQAIDPLRAQEFARQFAKAAPEFDTTPQIVNDENGKPVLVQLSKTAAPRVLQGLRPREKLELRSLGGVDVALNLADLKPGQQFKRTMTPGEIASNQIARANLGLASQRLDLDRQSFAQRAFAEKAPTEGERKAATLLKRLEGSEAQLLDALKQSPSAAKPGVIEQGLRNVGAETIANTLTPSARQRVEAAQLDILDAALTLGTGAAYTREQLEGYRRAYFPQIGDDAATIADKQDRLNNVIDAAKISAGRAGQLVTPTPRRVAGNNNGWSIQRVGE